jgi:hypothetical protein
MNKELWRWHSKCNGYRESDRGCGAMATKCEIVGWLFLDDGARVLVRDEHGQVSAQGVDPATAFAHTAIQTGSFRRNPIIDPVTNETLGYDMEWLSTPHDAAV